INISNLYTSIFRAFEKMELDLAIAVVRAVLFLPAAAWALFNHFGLIPVFNIFLVSNILSLSAAKLIFLRQMGWPEWDIDLGFCRDQLAQTVPLWLSQLLGIAYLKLAPLLLFRMKGEAAVGLYNAGFIVVDGFWILAACFISAIFPIISHLSTVSLSEAKKEYLSGLRISFLASLPAGACIIFYALPIVRVIYGEKFIEIVPLFRFLTVAAILVVLDTNNALTLIGIGRQGILPFINASGLLLNLMLTIFFIFKFGYTGPAYALIASESLVVLLGSMALKKYLVRGHS
ncbi:MAG: polysaccharide biosynthesis C-terminal domain-containing protein, partial [Candidatus Omnitrophica bacterium]|nr:polysaccharide biosynthesis C-terminal domain-containing protein [Candidatus Omnitrophota bacterium]